MKRIILCLTICLFYINVNAQDGNVGVGTNSPEAKLHVNGDLIVDDKLEIRNDTDATIFLMDPDSQKFEISDHNGNVFYHIAVETPENNLKTKNQTQKRSNSTNNPRITMVLNPDGIFNTTIRRPDGTIESIQSISETGYLETLFYPDGVTPRQTTSNSSFFPADIITDYNSDGIATRETIKDDSGSFSETFFQADGETEKSRTTYEASPSNKITKEKFDENGDLIDKVESESSFVNFFDKDENMVSSMELQNGYTQTIHDTPNGLSNMSYAEGNTIEDTNSGGKTDVYAGNIMVQEDGATLNVKNLGIDVTDPNADLSFFMDIFGISKFENGNFVGLDFNTFGGGIDVLGDMDVDGMLSKSGGSFKIDHPLDPKNKFLYHSFVESPDMMNVYNGNIITDVNGEAIVKLPSYFEALNIDYRYQLTVIGSFAQATIWEKVANNQFVIKTNEPNIEVSWQVTGIRNDEFAKDNRIKIEVDKQGTDKGKLLYDPNRNEPYSENLKMHWDRIKGKK